MKGGWTAARIEIKNLILDYSGYKLARADAIILEL